MVAKILKYSFLIIIAGGVFLYFGYDAAGYFSFIIGGFLVLLNRWSKKKPQKREPMQRRRYTLLNWWYLNNS